MPYNFNDKEEIKKIQLKMLKYMASFNKEKFICDMYGKGGFNYEEFNINFKYIKNIFSKLL